MSALPPCCASVALFVFVGFSDDRRLALVIRFGVAVFVFVIIGVSRRNRVAHVGDEAPVDRGEVLGDALGHVGSLLDVATVMRGRYHAGPGSSKRVDATRRHGGGSQRKMKRTRKATAMPEPPLGNVASSLAILPGSAMI